MATDAKGATSRLLELASQARLRPAISLGLGMLAGGATPEYIIREVLAPVQRRVGSLWEANEWGIAEEHAATAVVDAVLGAVALEIPEHQPQRGEVIVACAEGEHHTMPARMGAEILRAAGWDVTFLGGSIPADDLQRLSARREPDAVVISVTVARCLPGARRCFTAISELGIPVLAAGAAFGTDAQRARRLGAGGWLGPDADLRALPDLCCTEPQPWPIPPEALALELHREAIEATCVAAMMTCLPTVGSSSAERLRRTRTDVGDVLGFLTAAVDMDDDQIFSAFTAWWSGVLANRHAPPSFLDESLEIVSGVLDDAGMARAGRLCAEARRIAAER